MKCIGKSISQFIGILIFATLLVSCGYREATYFRKHETTQEQERAAWGLCGGNFLITGQIHPSVNRRVVDCMISKGFVTLNEYYVEDHIEFIRVAEPSEHFYTKNDMEACGVIIPQNGICEFFPYAFRRQIQSISSCMAQKGYVPALPRYKQGLRIFEDGEPVPNLFCMSLTPANQKGSISLGKWRIE